MTKTHKLGMFTLVAMNLAAIVNLAALPVEAEYGFSSAFYYLLAAVLFLVPVSLVAAELASLFKDKQGGVFYWISAAFGTRFGLLGVWMNWLMSLMWYPTVLTFASVSLAYIGINQKTDMALASNKLYIAAVVMGIFWLATFLVSRGLKWVSRITRFGVCIGTIIPALLLIISGIVYFVMGGKTYMSFSESFFPDFTNIQTLVLASSIFLYYAGMELSSVHVRDITNPQKNFPRAIFFSASLTVLIFIFGTWAIALIIPKTGMNITQSLLIAYHSYFTFFKIPWLTPIVAIALAFGVLTGVLTWINGPSKALLAVAQEGYLPKLFKQTNKNGIQTPILIVQGIIVSLINILFIVVPSVQAFYQILAQMAVIMYLVMYMLMFLSVIHLRFTMPNAERAFRVGKKGNGLIIFVGSLGFLGALSAFILSFVPPSQIATGNTSDWYLILICGTVVAITLPFIFYALRKKAQIIKNQ